MALANWAGNITFSTDRLHRPTSVAELQRLVAGSRQLRALGSGHSFNRIADTTGDLVSVRDLAGTVEVVEHEDGPPTVLVPGGATYAQVAVALHQRGLALPNTGSLPHISIAGACATGTHGSGDGNRCLAAGAVAVEFVRADGELVRLDRHDPAFGGAVLALGALGVVTRLELATVPDFRVRQDVWLDVPIEQVVERFAEIMGSAYSVSLFDDHATGDAVDRVWLKQVVAPGVAVADGSAWGGTAAELPQHPLTAHDPGATTVQLGEPGPWQDRLPHFRIDATPSDGDEQQSEFLVPREHGAAALLAVRALDLRDVMLINEIRTVAADELWLSPFRGRDSVGVHFTWRNDDAAVQRAVARVEDALAPFDPRPHWGKVFRTRRTAHLDRLDDFRALVAEHDPSGTFRNPFLAEQLGL